MMPILLVIGAFEGTNLHESHTFAIFTKGEEQICISWMPQSLRVKVIRGQEAGINLTYQQTLDLAKKWNCKITLYEPIPISESLFQKAKKQKELLESGQIYYKVISFKTQACNCIHAVSNICGPLNTGTAHGRAASEMVLQHLKQNDR